MASGLASNGIEAIAENGTTGALTTEIDAAIAQGFSGPRILGGGTLSPGAVTVHFTGTTAFRLLTLVSMIAPSPDWFLEIASVSLLDSNGQWLDTPVIDLYAWNAGTDSGANFNSGNQDTSPQDQSTDCQGERRPSNGTGRTAGSENALHWRRVLPRAPRGGGACRSGETLARERGMGRGP